jgi:hypothetical protein
VTALSWILFELATHPDEQRRLRDEINSVQAADHVDGIKTVNFDALPFLNAVIKVNLPHVYQLAYGWKRNPTFRRPYVSIPLFRTFSGRRLMTKSYPCSSKSIAGPEVSPKSSTFLREPILSYQTLPIASEHTIYPSRPETYTFFRNRDIWGEDADVWRPSRWLDGSVKSPGATVGIWTNLYARE